MEDSGAPATWQPIGMDFPCGGDTAATVMHEVLHALGVGHEHNRPDRDQYLNMNLQNSYMANQYYTIRDENWLNTQYPFELESVMTYCSYCSSANGHPVATLKDGRTFDDGPHMTTTDALQIQYKYCKMPDADYKYKETVQCGTLDNFGTNKPVFTDRLCDNQPDCPNGADEGKIAPCIPDGEPLPSGCCSVMSFNGVRFEYAGQNAGHDYWNAEEMATNNHKHIIFFSGFSNGGDWFVTDKTIEEITTGGSISWYSRVSLQAPSKCPPTEGWSWQAPTCIYKGAQTEDFCAKANCHANATCKNLFNSHQCTCKDGFRNKFAKF